ncbi:MAG: hypothetical protein WD069_20010 [Planctomycetales bacterium]
MREGKVEFSHVAEEGSTQRREDAKKRKGRDFELMRAVADFPFDRRIDDGKMKNRSWLLELIFLSESLFLCAPVRLCAFASKIGSSEHKENI